MGTRGRPIARIHGAERARAGKRLSRTWAMGASAQPSRRDSKRDDLWGSPYPEPDDHQGLRPFVFVLVLKLALGHPPDIIIRGRRWINHRAARAPCVRVHIAYMYMYLLLKRGSDVPT